MMSPELAAIATMLARHDAIELGIVFGSLARGTHAANSDADIAFFSPRPLPATERLDLIGALAATTGRPIDLLELNGLHGPVLARLLRDGRVVLNRKPSTLAALIVRAATDEEDFAPYRRRIIAARRQAWIAN